MDDVFCRLGIVGDGQLPLVHIPTLGFDIKVSTASWQLSGKRISAKQKEARHLVTKLAHELKHALHQERTPRVIFVYLGIGGTLLDYMPLRK